MQPDVLLLDEPTSSFDPKNVALLEQTLNELSAVGISLVISTHDVDFSYRFAKRGIVFSGGEIIADGNIDEIFTSVATLLQAGLRKPLLCAVAELLENRFGKKCGRYETKKY